MDSSKSKHSRRFQLPIVLHSVMKPHVVPLGNEADGPLWSGAQWWPNAMSRHLPHSTVSSQRHCLISQYHQKSEHFIK